MMAFASCLTLVLLELYISVHFLRRQNNSLLSLDIPVGYLKLSTTLMDDDNASVCI
jgi:hypothetical protein